jgi:solute carrier family 35 protein E3
MNLNLAWNSVGFYQISKLACIPLTLLLEYLMNGKKASQNVQLSLVVILLGVGVATVSDIEMNMIGSIFATIAIIFTTLAQIYTSTRQKELGLDALQLLHQSGPFISMGMMMSIPFLDNVWTAPHNKRPLVQFEWDMGTIGLIMVTCIFALMVNVTNYYVIGKTSPVTYQVVGHFKTILILVLGYVAFSQQVNYTNLFGVSVAVVGMILYGEIKRREGAAASSSARPTSVAIVSDRVDTTSDRAAAGAKELLPLVRIDSNKPAPSLPAHTEPRANAV